VYDSFGYELQNGYEQYGRYEAVGDGEDLVFVGYGHYIAIEMVSNDLDDDTPILTVAYETLDGSRGFVDMRRDLLSKKKEVQNILLNCGADVYDTSLTTLMNCLRVSEATAKRGWCYQRTGWLIENAGSDEEILSYKGRYLVSNADDGADTPYIGKYDLCKKGSFSAWKTMVNQHVLGQIALEVAVLIGLSPIISCEWGSRNLVYHFMGDSTTGKTTSAILAVSVAGCPNPLETRKRFGADGKQLRSLMSSWKGTSNALIGKLDGLDGTLMVFDELSKVENTEVLTSTLYTISDGAGKDRMMSPTEMQSTNVIRTNVLSVGEESLLEKANNQNTGLNIRVCEISTQFTKSAAQAEAISACCYENYGHAAMKFAKYLVNNLTYGDVSALRQSYLESYEQELIAAGSLSKATRRLAEFGAILLTVADIAEKALGIAFSKDKIIEFLVDQQNKADGNADIGVRAHNALRGFVNANIGSFITDNTSTWTKSTACLGKVDNPPGGPMEVSFVASEFPKIMKQLGFHNTGLVLQKFKAAGYLKYEAGKNYRKRQITSAGGTVRVNVVLFP
jgi:uncharacterized protein (DUF927 family)